MQRIDVTNDMTAKVHPGDILEIHYKTLFDSRYLMAAQIAAVESRLNKNKNFVLISDSYGGGELVFTVRYVEDKFHDAAPELQKAGIISVTACVKALEIVALVGIVWLVRDSIYLVKEGVSEAMESPAGKIGIAGLGSMGIAAAITAIYALFKGKK